MVVGLVDIHMEKNEVRTSAWHHIYELAHIRPKIVNF